LGSRSSARAVSFLYALLSWNPSWRSTAQEALKHSYFRTAKPAPVSDHGQIIPSNQGNHFVIYILSDQAAQRCPGQFFLTEQLRGTHPNILRSTKFFLLWSATVLELGVPRVRGLGWRGHNCVKNLPWVVVEFYTKFGGDWCCGLRDIGTYMLFFYI